MAERFSSAPRVCPSSPLWGQPGTAPLKAGTAHGPTTKHLPASTSAPFAHISLAKPSHMTVQSQSGRDLQSHMTPSSREKYRMGYLRTGRKERRRALKDIRKFAMKELGTPDVRIDTRLNKAVWAKGIRNVPYRIRVRLSRKRNEDEDSPNKLYTLVTYVPVTTLKNLQTVNVDEN
ncbi:60S ribosomal protein L31-like [Canis lupus familiaris]|uniref:60S ribosomal protein L31-like n=1 Tax=Canis lupus familiaris TaxID=9615 RepID=UPI00005A10F5|nr:60S ribosomal protein L31-like [Canis lupus familiaris]XP_038394856.1 60S ribosomal protein L31-like [Canis lupus familiaris]|eukprot:XP_013969902.1 60S ribosomal protein L31-like [Canis lupus familiaris]